MRYDAEQKERTRERVLKEAATLLREGGPQKLGVADVMGRAGLTHGGFYAHFGSKDELMAEAVGTAFQDARSLFDRSTEGRTPQEALAAYVGRYLSRTHRDSRDRGCPLPALAADLPRMTDAARERFAAGVEQLTILVRDLVDAAGIAGAEIVGPSVVAEMVGAIALARAVPDVPQSDAILANSRAALLARLGLEMQA